MTTYLIRVPARLQAIDVPATVIHLATGRHKRPVRGEECRREREEMAALVGPGPIANILLSDHGISVASTRANLWEVRRWPSRPVPDAPE